MLDIHLVPAHSLAIIDFVSENEVQINWFNEEGLKRVFEEKRVKIAHEVIISSDGNFTKEYVLTASTDELQKFIIKYGNDEDAYLCDENNNNFICARLKKVK